MADVNKVILIGRLTRDPTLKYTPSQMAICEFSLAVGRKFKTASGESREETTFVECTVWAKGAEIFNQYMTKGKQVYVEGRLKLDTWEDKNGGGKRSKLTVTVEDFQFLGDRGGAGGQGGGGGSGGGYEGEGGGGGGGYERQQSRGPVTQNRGGGQRPPSQQQPPQAPYGDEQAFNDDDIPF